MARASTKENKSLYDDPIDGKAAGKSCVRKSIEDHSRSPREAAE